MKYTYAYKTSDGTRHEATMDAASRDAVFQALRAQGIRAIKVVAADGSKANGEVRGVRRRVVALAVALAGVSVGAVAWLAGSRSGASTAASGASSFETATMRRQVIGDLAVIEKGIRTGWADVFEHEGERFLASFAIPGVKAGQRNTTIEEITASLSRRVAAAATDAIEARQIKAMVEGMKAEARAYIAAGGTAVEYGRRLTERQDAEIAVYKRVKADIEAAKPKMAQDQFEQFCDTRNDELRNLGIRPVVIEE